jgi:hypothetical protein
MKRRFKRYGNTLFGVFFGKITRARVCEFYDLCGKYVRKTVKTREMRRKPVKKAKKICEMHIN